MSYCGVSCPQIQTRSQIKIQQSKKTISDVTKSYNDNINSFSPHRQQFFSEKLKSTTATTCDPVVSVSSITAIGPTGIILNSPGTYTFANNIIWIPGSPDCLNAITIAANNVTLDMNKCTLECSNPNNYPTVGIYSPSVDNITIKNGTIVGMGKDGIRIEGTSSKYCNNITIQNINIEKMNTNEIITYTTPTGIKVLYGLQVLINSCIVRNISVNVGNFTCIDLVNTMYSTVISCLMDNCINSAGALVGVSHFFCVNLIIEACSVNNFTTLYGNNLNTQGHTCIGYVPFFSTGINILYCKASNIVGCCDDAHGMSLFCDYGPILVQGCLIDTVKDGVESGTGAKSTGIEVYSSDAIIRDCTVCNISAINPQDKQCTGFSVAGSVAIGGEATNVTFINCKATNVNVYDEFGAQSSSLGYGTGFGWAPDIRDLFLWAASNITWECCTAINCQVGFDTWWQKFSLWKNIKTINCGISLFNLTNSVRVLSCNPCSECDPAAVLSVANVSKNNTFCNITAEYL